MRVLSVIFLTFLMISTSFSQTIQGEFVPTPEVANIKEGDVFEATIRVWPVENVDLLQFKKLEKTVLFNSLYLAQITSLGVSQNNSDVVELNAVFMVKSSKAQSSYSFKYNDSIIELQLGSLVFADLKDQSKDYYTLDQSLNKSIVWIIMTSIIILLFTVGVLKRKFIQEYISGFKSHSEKISKKKYMDLFKNANKREDFESLYVEKDLWIKLLVEVTPAHIDFFKTLNQYQFKKEWSPAEDEEVKAAFDIIRRSFEK